MSDALNYLLKVRPDAMKSYFDFIKKSGTSLDPKTRAIISVITKVDNQTETGLRQYLVRALRAGVSADEIQDLVQWVSEHAPVGNDIAQAVDVQIVIENQ